MDLRDPRHLAKLRAARERLRAQGVKCHGRKSLAERHPAIVPIARRLRCRNPETGRPASLREIAKALADAGYTTAKGKPFAASSVARMLNAPNRPE